MIDTLQERSLSLDDAVVYTVAYADVFDFPITVAEIHRYLAYRAGSPAAVAGSIAERLLPHRRLSRLGEYHTLAGREELVGVRARRARTAAGLWPAALRFGRIMAQVPFVRMVAVTGALAVDNVEAGADIDYFIVAANGRLWLCRAMLIALVKWAARTGVRLCPNYLVSERALVFQEQTFYSAHELAQMIPTHGFELYDRIRRMNPWALRFLPNAAGAPQSLRAASMAGAAAPSWTRRLLEPLFAARPGDYLERWEMERKIRKFARGSGLQPEASFGPDWCKGHVDNHGANTNRALLERAESLQIDLR